MAEVHSTYQWELSEPDRISVNVSGNRSSVNATVTISKNNVFAIIDGTYQVIINVTTRTVRSKEVTLTKIISNPKICTSSGDSYSISLDFTGNIGQNDTFSTGSYKDDSFIIQKGVDGKSNSNKYLHILNRPTIIENLTIDDTSVTDKKYIEGSSIPIDRIKNISTKDFYNIEMSDVENPNIFSKLSDPNKNGVTIKTNQLSIPKLTVVDLPESKNAPINICKTKSMNKGITFKTSDPDTNNNHFGYIIHIEDYEAAGYNSVWVDRKTLDRMFIGMPDDIMSTTEKFVCDTSFRFCELTYEEERLVPFIYLNNERKKFIDDDLTRLNKYAPECYKVIIKESDSDVERHHLMTLKNIEFVKFGDKVIKLNYEPLYNG